MKFYQFFTISIIVFLAIALVPGGVVQAFPPLPSSFYGSIKRNDVNLPEGTIIQALVNGQVFATSIVDLYQGDSVYSITVPGDDPGTVDVEGGQEGSMILFVVEGEQANQTAVWHSGTNVVLDLTITTNSNLPTSTLTSAPQIIQTGTLPAMTVTPTLSGAQTETTAQPTMTGTQQPVETFQEGDAGADTSATENSQAEILGLSTSTQTSGRAVGSSGEDNDLSSPDQEDDESIHTQDSRKIWIGIGIAVILLTGIGSGAWYLRKRTKPDQDLL